MASKLDEDDVIRKQYKLIILGDGAVGKTSMALRFVDENFSGTYKQTLGVDFFNKKIELPGMTKQVDGTEVTVRRKS